MLRRLLPTLVALGAGWLILCAGLVALHGIFQREREEGHRALADRRVALEQFANQSLAELLRTELAQARPRIDAALDDPLLDDAGLLLVRGTAQLLPRTAAPREDPATPGVALLESLRREGAAEVAATFDSDDPMRERLRLTAAFVDALPRAQAAELDRRFRELLAHRARFIVPAAKDVPATLYVLEAFEARGRPDHALLQGLLRDGLRGATGASIPGLQRLLLLRRGQFARADFDALTKALIDLCERVRVEALAFADRAHAQVRPELGLWPPLPGPVLTPTGWYAEPDPRDGSVNGVAIDLSERVETVRQSMRARALLDEDDALLFDPPSFVVALSDWTLTLRAPRITRQLADLEGRYRLKTGLLILCALLALAIVALAAVAQERKLRFVALRSDFVSTVSHELRTPLSAIRVMAETLERRVGGKDGAGDYPSRIVSEADALSRLVENILTFNRLDKGGFDARREPVALEEVATRAVSDASEQLGRAIDANTEALRGQTVQADPELLRILFSNLVHNACRYTTQPTPRIVFEGVNTSEGETVRVTDNGVGIPPGKWEQVFEEFRRLRHDGLPTQGGSGLGLAICRRIMALHGGTLRIAASSSQGTTFELRFPAS